MGEHKHNPTALAAKKGEIPPKKKSNLSKREVEELVKDRLGESLVLPGVLNVHGRYA